MNATFKIPSGSFARTFARWQAVTGRAGGELLRDRAGMLARYMAASTQPARATGKITPKGGTKEEQRLGQNAVADDLARIMDAPRGAFAVLPANHQPDLLVLIHKGGKKKGEVYLIDRNLYLTDAVALSAFHQSRKIGGGRVTRAGTYPDVGRGRWKSRQVAVTTKALRDAHFDRMKGRVGWAKAGWISAGQTVSSVGFSNVPAWIQKPAPGNAVVNLNGPRPFLRLINGVNYSQEVLRPEYAASAIQGFTRSLEKDMKAQIEHLLK